MIIKNNLIENSIQHFPRWMDIRKRQKTSTGGKLIESIAEEVCKIQNNIDEYISQFFIPYYKDKCDLITDYVYRINIGYVNIENIELENPKYKITIDINEFYNSKNLAYYQDGFVFIKDAINKIIYYMDKVKKEAFTEKINVWNQYDEFATFIGIKRYEDETNKELYNRIIETVRNVKNSSNDGLKYTIKSSLINLVPELKLEDISFERPTAENLIEKYNEYESLLCFLEKENKDTLKNKKWDIDKWENFFKNNSYLSHKWDTKIAYYNNGIGDNDDLKPVIIDNKETTDLKLSFYKKSENAINTYIKNNNIKDTIELSLTKYNDTLIPYTANYTIMATDVANLSSNEIEFELYESRNIEKQEQIKNLILDEHQLNGIKITKGGRLKKNKYYRIMFTPKDEYSQMELYKCNVENCDDLYTVIEDLLIEKDNFKIKNDILINDNVKKYITNINELDSSINIIDTGNGLTIDKINDYSEMKIIVNNCKNEELKIESSCEMSEIEQDHIELNNMYYSIEKNKYIPDIINEDIEKSMIITIKANKIKFSTSNNCIINAYIGEEYINLTQSIIDDSYIYESIDYNSPKEFRVEIFSIEDNLEIYDLFYTNYEISVSTKFNKALLRDEDKNKYILPNTNYNEIIIKMITYTQFSPVIKKIFIGKNLKDVLYVTDCIYTKDNDNYYLDIDSNCNVKLLYSDEQFSYDDYNNVDSEENYNTNDTYTAIKNNAHIILNTERYSNINKISTSFGICNFINNSYRITLQSGESIKDILISGTIEDYIDKKSLNELIKSKYDKYDKDLFNLYSDKLNKCFVIENNNMQIPIKIEPSDFNISNATNIVVTGTSIDMQPVFVSSDNNIVMNNEHNLNFSNFYIYPKNAKEYIANNEYTLYDKIENNIKIINTFNNEYIDGKLMSYKILNNDADNCDIYFNKNKKDYIIGKDDIIISLKNFNYNKTNINIKEKINLNSTIKLKDIYTLENNTAIELAQYIIENNDKYEIKYTNKNEDCKKSEKIYINSNGLNKLKYSNIFEITYIGTEQESEYDSSNKLNNSSYSLDKTNGILTINDKNVINNSKELFINYIINKPIALKFNLEYLYKKNGYMIDSYKLINIYNIKDLKNNNKYNLNNFIEDDKITSQKILEDYKKSDIVYSKCIEPGFISKKIDNYIVINKTANNNSIAIKSGYYYQYGKEYYMFATDQSQKILKDNYMSMNEIRKDNGKLLLNKETTNYIKNSKMKNSIINNSFHIDNFKNIKNFKGSSNLNKITSCDSYNYWNTFAMDMTLINGFNGLGLYFKPSNNIDIAYAALNISKYSSEKTNISFYCSKGLKAFIGKERKINDIPLTDTFSIESLIEITNTTDNQIKYFSFKKEENYNYYLILMGQGIIDDIIISDTEMDLDNHIKNLDLLNLNIKESNSLKTLTRIMFDNSKGYKNNNTEIDRNGYIVPASNIDWNITKIKNYKTYDDLVEECSLKNIKIIKINDKDCIATTDTIEGNITTKPIYIENINTVKSIIYKINGMPIKQMQGIKMKLLQSQDSNGKYIECVNTLNNSSTINYTKNLIYQYIKLSIDIPKDKVINNIDIYIEYKSDNNNAPNEIINNGGTFISKVYDSYNESIYELKSINIDNMTDDTEIYIRAAKEKSGLSVWTDWKKININNEEIINSIIFDKYRFFQIKVELHDLNSKIKINYLDLEVIG